MHSTLRRGPVAQASLKRCSDALHLPLCHVNRGLYNSRFGPLRAHADAAFAGLSTWLQSEGGYLSNIDMQDCHIGDIPVRGLVATKHLYKGDTVISIPLTSALRDDEISQAYAGAPWNVSLALYLCSERAKGPASRWYAYIQTLPSESGGPLLMTREQVLAIGYEPAVHAVLEYQQQVFEAYEKLQQQGSPLYPTPSLEEFLWAIHMVQSRTIRFAITSCRVMIPGVDLLNHGGSAANGDLVLGSSSWQVGGGRTICFNMTKDVQAGQQVLWSYGNRSNDDFFVYHGFCIDDNPYEEFQLFRDVVEVVEWYCSMTGGEAEEQHQQQQQQGSGAGVRAKELEKVAVSAAEAAQASAQTHCPAPHIPGTTSRLLIQMKDLSSPKQEQQQQQQEQHSGETSTSTSSTGSSNYGSWRRCSSSSSSSSGYSSTTAAAAGDGRGGGRGATGLGLEELIRRGPVSRRLASLRLHRPEWGTPGCPPTSPELVIQNDGWVDVRLVAALSAMVKLNHSRDHSAGGFPNSESSNSTGGGSSSSSGRFQAYLGDSAARETGMGDHGGGAAGTDDDEVMTAVAELLRLRCQVLLDQWRGGGKAVAAEQEGDLKLSTVQQSSAPAVTDAVQQFRQGKENVLRSFCS